jgi:hypothetical protein
MSAPLPPADEEALLLWAVTLPDRCFTCIDQQARFGWWLNKCAVVRANARPLAAEIGWCLTTATWEGGSLPVYRLLAPGEGHLARDAARFRAEVIMSHCETMARVARFAGDRKLIKAAREYRKKAT